MRKWTVFVTRNSGLIIALIAALLLMSLFTVRGLNIEAFPDPSPPMVEIVTIYEGKSA